mmetsp:Transcript_32960/g.67365  ORF Transcript_32960/g.67365 Transcript_32960/m.67365 type:complete len:561 (+) Transcript_32960:52-1734(+)
MSTATTTSIHHRSGEASLSSRDGSLPKSPSAASLHDNSGDRSVVSSSGSICNSNEFIQSNGTHPTMRETACNYVFGNCKALIFGQFLSLFLAGTGAIQSSLYLSCGLSAPTFSMFTFYFPLSIITMSRLIYQSRCNPSCTRQLSSSSLQEQGQQIIECQTCNALPRQRKQNTTKSSKIRTRIRAKPEKRNHLLSHWSTQMDDMYNTRERTHDQFNTEEDAGYLMASNDNNIANSTCRECSEQRTSSQKSHSLFGIIPLKCNPLLYAAVAVTDVYANYATILAFKYTTLTSVSLFDALAIPSAIILSRFAFGRRYTKVHICSIGICCVGITINALQDYKEDKALELSDDAVESEQEELIEADYPHKMLGDTLAIIGGILFGIDNTLQEVAVRDWGSQLEYLGCMTFFATVISFLQMMTLERDEILDFFRQSDSDTCPQYVGLLLLFAFSVGGMLNYLGISAFLRISDAAFLNLSLLTGDAWAVLYSVYAEHIYPPGTFYVALVITVTGVLIYETAPSPVTDNKVEERPEVLGEIQLVENVDADTDTEREVSTTVQEGRVFV